MKQCFAILVFGLFGLDAVGQIEGDGTVVVINSAQNEIVFAADSRTAFSDSYSDQECKIRALTTRYSLPPLEEMDSGIKSLMFIRGTPMQSPRMLLARLSRKVHLSTLRINWPVVGE
jgi:hypothetical protein